MTTPNGPRVQIRPRASDDLPAAAAALVQVHHSDGYPVEGVADPAAWLTSPHQIAAWVAELDDHVVGHVALSEPQPDDAAATLWPRAPRRPQRPRRGPRPPVRPA